MSRSTMLAFAFPNGLLAHRPPVCGITIGVRLMYRARPGSWTTTSDRSYFSKSLSSYVYFFFGFFGSFFAFAGASAASAGASGEGSAGASAAGAGSGAAGGTSSGGGGGVSSGGGGGGTSSFSGGGGGGLSSGIVLTGRASPSCPSRAGRGRRR